MRTGNEMYDKRDDLTVRTGNEMYDKRDDLTVRTGEEGNVRHER